MILELGLLRSLTKCAIELLFYCIKFEKKNVIQKPHDLLRWKFHWFLA